MQARAFFMLDSCNIRATTNSPIGRCGPPPRALVLREVARGEVLADPLETQRVAVLPALQCGVGQHLCDDDRVDVGQRHLVACGAEPQQVLEPCVSTPRDRLRAVDRRTGSLLDQLPGGGWARQNWRRASFTWAGCSRWLR